MVFHSLDKITSVFIHLSPSLLMYGLRWKWHGTLSLPDDISLSVSNSLIALLKPSVINFILENRKE